MQLERDTRLGKYIIRERLGGGGMGVVYRARHAQLGRDFAIKTIHSDKASDKDFALRFRREAEAIARIDHPNIVSVADFVEGDPAKGEISYIVMEYLKGKDLGRIIKEGGPLEITRAVDRILEVSAAVDACHRRGYLHRDLKPTNIFLTEYNFIEVAKVLDFGVAKVWAEDERKGPQDEELTKKGTVFGTPEYIAPELLKDRSASPKSDQYSIGVVLFAALTGRKPFIADPKAAVPDLDLWMSVAKGIHPTARSLRSDIAPGLDAVIERTMSLSPEARFRDVHELGGHLLRWASEPARHRWTAHFTSAPVAINLQLSIAIDAHTSDSTVPPLPSPTGATIPDKPEQRTTRPVGTEELKREGEEGAASARRRAAGADAPSMSVPISVDEATAAPAPATTGALPRSSLAAFLRRPVALVLGGGFLLVTAIVVAAFLHRSRPAAPVGATPPPAIVDRPAPATPAPPSASPSPPPAPLIAPSSVPVPPPSVPAAAPEISPSTPAKRPGRKRPKHQIDQEGFPIPTEIEGFAMHCPRTYLIAIMIVCVAGVARADDRPTADAMIARGLELRREGKPDEALEQFQRAHALAPSARTLGHMGIVEGTLKHWIDAEDHLSAALALGNDAWVKKNQTLLQTALDSVKPHIGQLVFAGSAGAAVSVAGKPAGTLPNVGPVRVAAGTVLITATAPNSKQFVERVEVQGGMQTAVTINLQPVDIQPAPPTPAPPAAVAAPIRQMHPHYTWRTWTGGALLGLGAGLATWGIIWIAVDGNGAGGTCTETGVPNCRPVYDTKALGWILTAGGAAAAAAGGFLIYRAQSSGTDVRPQPRSALTLSAGASSLVDDRMHTYFALYVGVIPIPVGFCFKEPEARIWPEKFYAESAVDIRPFVFRMAPR